MNEYKKIISAIFIIGVIVVLATVLYVYTGGSNINIIPKTQNAGLEQLEQHMAIGVVEKISGKEIFLKDAKKMPNKSTTGNQEGESVVVTVDNTTVIENLIQKDLESIKSDLAEFVEKQKQGTATGAIPPEPFTRVKATFKDIKVGNTIVVFSSADISKLKTFVATGINIQTTFGGAVQAR